jgi:hypothetical protein
MKISLNFVFVLLLIYQFKHFIADYPLQGKYMLGKFKPGWGWILPLLAHVAVHGVFTFLIISGCIMLDWARAGYLKFNFADWKIIFEHFALVLPLKLAALDMGIHFVMDRIKASPNLLGRFKAITGVDYIGLLQNPPQKLKIVSGGVACCSIQPAEVTSTFKSNTLFWWCLGLDQMVHHLTHYAVIYIYLAGVWK